MSKVHKHVQTHKQSTKFPDMETLPDLETHMDHLSPPIDYAKRRSVRHNKIHTYMTKTLPDSPE